jgi:hypothetical protein
MLTRVRSRRLPLLLIAIGVALYAFGFAGVTFLDVAGVMSLWPIAAIAVGVDLLTRGRWRRVVIPAAFVAAVAFYAAGFWGAVVETAIAQPLHDAEAARITLQLGVGAVALDAAAPAGMLLTGTLRSARGERVTQALGHADATARLSVVVASEGAAVSGRVRTSTLSLTNAVPVDLRVQAGVGDVTLNLAAARASAIAVDAGVGSVDVTLPAVGGYAATVRLGVGSAVLRVPAGVEARITWQGGIGSLRHDGAFIRVGDVFTTAGYAEAAADRRVEVALRGGVGGVRLERGR